MLVMDAREGVGTWGWGEQSGVGAAALQGGLV